jgi:TrpR-related protein YerC/YecD
MAKFPRNPKLNKDKIQEIITDLCQAVALTGNSAEAAELLTDLLGRQELEMIARRFRVAEMLLDNLTYEDISKELKISPATIARVQVWLHESGSGYRKLIERVKKIRKSRDKSDKPYKLTGIKKKYPLYYWPQLIFDYWAENSTQKQKQEMMAIMTKLNNKGAAFKELETLFRQKRTSIL